MPPYFTRYAWKLVGQEPVLARQFRHGHAGLDRLEEPDDLLSGESTLFMSVLFMVDGL